MKDKSIDISNNKDLNNSASYSALDNYYQFTKSPVEAKDQHHLNIKLSGDQANRS